MTRPHNGNQRAVQPVTLSQRILSGLPATLPELVAIADSTTPLVNAMLCHLRERGLVRRSDRRGERQNERGRLPRIWERVR
jgi:Mn-dependent DtxR family transcriptional regulator